MKYRGWFLLFGHDGLVDLFPLGGELGEKLVDQLVVVDQEWRLLRKKINPAQKKPYWPLPVP